MFLALRKHIPFGIAHKEIIPLHFFRNFHFLLKNLRFLRIKIPFRAMLYAPLSSPFLEDALQIFRNFDCQKMV